MSIIKAMKYFGEVEFGEKLVIGFQGEQPHTGEPDDFVPGMFDVVDPRTGDVLIRQQLVTQYETAPFDINLYFVEIDTLATSSGMDLFEPRRQYLLNIYEDVTGPLINAPEQIRGIFYVSTSIKKMLNRVLGLLGENQVLDNFTYDQAGNITGLRMRLFDNSNDAENATQGATGPEPGETAQYDVEQDHELPRSLRSFHRSFNTYVEDARE